MGAALASVLAEYLNRTGSIILILTLLFLALILSTQFSFGRLFAAIGSMIVDQWAALLGAHPRPPRREAAREAAPRSAEEASRQAAGEGSAEAAGPIDDTALRRRGRARRQREAAAGGREPVRRGAADESLAHRRDGRRGRRRAQGGIVQAHSPTGDQKLPVPTPAPLPLPEPEKLPAERKKAAYTFPPMALLDAPKTERKIDERELMEGARLLEEKCREFSVEGSVVQIHPGPVVTTYEFKPDAGVKYSKITGLADDLCLAMQAESVLIDRIPGKSTVGIQIPNPNREQISLRELLESDAYRRSQSKLTLALGKTIHGEPFVATWRRCRTC